MRATAFNIDPFSNMGGINSQTGQMIAGRKNLSNSGKAYKRGQGSLGPQGGVPMRPGTAQKRPASPNTQGLLSKGQMGHNSGPSPYSLGLVQHHNNLVGGINVMNKQRANSSKPGSAPSKNREKFRSHSPMNIEGTN